MDIYILRHGEAEPRGAGIKEAARALTPKGKRDVKGVLALAARAMEAPGAILTSPYTRAKETAAIAAKRYAGSQIVETANLLPSASPEKLWLEIGTLRGVQGVLLAGHEPHLSNFLRFLLEAAVAVDLKKGAMVRVTTQNLTGSPRGELKWMITPRLVRAK